MMQGIVQKILSNPGKYSVQELQSAMQTGSLPAYVAIPLIQQKTQEQQRMQLSQQAQGAPQEGQPTVADSVMQQAMTGGIEQLPSNLPSEGFAGGGIVAFNGGGYPRAKRELSEQEKAANRYYGFPEDYDMQAVAPGMGVMDKLGALVPDFLKPGAKWFPESFYQPRLRGNENISQNAVRLADMAIASKYPGQFAPATPEAAPAPEMAGPPVPAGPSTVPAAAPAGGIAGLPTGEIDTARKAYEDMVAKTEGAQFPTRNFSKREERLAKEEAGLAKAKEDNLNMALIQAGLSMMGAKGGMNALQTIGAGGIAGLQAYAQGKKDIRDLEKDIATRRDRIEELMAAGEEKKAEYELKKLEPRLALQKSMFETASRMQLGREEIAGRARVAGMQLSSTGKMEDARLKSAERSERAKYFQQVAASADAEIKSIQSDPASMLDPVKKVRLPELIRQRDAALATWSSLLGIAPTKPPRSDANVIDFSSLPSRR